jgi:arylsulfatase A-like enzyme
MKKRALVLITVDCLRADHVGFQGYRCPVTPFLDSLAETSVVISDAIVAGTPTYFSFPAIMASRYPLSLGRETLGIAPGEATLATALHDAGYRTAAFLAGNPYLSPRFGYHQGFDEFRDFLDSVHSEESKAVSHPASKRVSDLNRRIEGASRRTGLTAAAYDELYFWYCQWRSARKKLSMDQLRRYPAADVVIDQACSWLRNLGDNPVFLWIHLMDPHHPYYPPQEALSSLGVAHISARRACFLNAFWDRLDVGPRRLERYRKEILSLYDAGVYCVDKQISRFVDVLRQSRLWDETVFVVTADHGEEFLENGARYHSPTNLPEHLIHVPLLLHAPELAGMRFSQGSFSLLHLAPTLLDAMGAAIPDSFQGQSYWKQISSGGLLGESAIAECVEACNNPFQVEERIRPRLLAIRDRQYKLVIHFSDKSERLYDLENDPEEHSPLPAGALTRERVRLLQVVRAHLEKTRGNRNADFALRARLYELGHSMGLKRQQAPTSAVPG